MMSNFKQLLLISLLGLSITGCSNLQTAPQNTIPAAYKQQLSTSEPIIAYFDKNASEGEDFDSGYSLTPTEDGFYRKLLGRDKAGRFLVQDFYQKSNQPQTSPFWIKETLALRSFDIIFTDGPITTYFENGRVASVSNYQEGLEVGTSKTFYHNGQQAFEYEIADPETHSYKIKFWYEDGKTAVEGFTAYKDEQPAYNAKAWDRQGQLVTDSTQIYEIIESIYQKSDEE